MTLSRNEIIRLLQIASCYDNRNPAESMIVAWEDAACRGRWVYAEAAEAIKIHYANSVEFIKPAHVTQLIRSARQDAAMREPVTPSAARGAIDCGWPVGDDPFHGQRNSPELEQIHEEANRFVCRDCKAPIGVRCKNSITGNATKIPHARRLSDATKARKRVKGAA